jgi:cation diffusion facilitator CzcD-associated flavoprotein CzcO
MALDIGRRELRRDVAAARRRGRSTPRVVIVGAGLSGLGFAIQLIRSGVRDFTIVEQSDGVGGTWRDNTYPGSGCDVPSHLYSFSFAPKSDWTRRFAEQPEILDYAEWCVERFRIGPHLRLGTTVLGAEFDEPSGVWNLTVAPRDPDGGVGAATAGEPGVNGVDGATGEPGGTGVIHADTVIFACGQLNRPFIPDVPGLDRFAGPAWHSARWDHRSDLAGRRVAVVGSGASAIQFVPPVAARAASVTIYQRSPNYVGPKKDRPYSARTRWMLERVPAVERAYRWWIYWILESRWLWFRKDSWAGRQLGRLFIKGIRADVVSERLPEESVVPDYPVGCKRILISNDWYPALMRSTVEVVDRPIDHIESDAVVTVDGQRRPADVLIFGTGFVTTEFLSHIPVTGEGGRRLSDQWARGAHAYRGVAVAGFPNLYLLYGPNTNLGHNSILFMVERQINLILQAVALQTRTSTRTTARTPAAGPGTGMTGRVDITPEAYRRDDERTQEQMAATTWVTGCTSWYKSGSGRVTNNWPTWTVRYWFDTLRLRRSELGPVSPPTAATTGSATAGPATATAR